MASVGNNKDIKLPLVMHNNNDRYFTAPLAATLAIILAGATLYILLALFSPETNKLGGVIAILLMSILLYYVIRFVYIAFNQGMKISANGIDMWNYKHSFTPFHIKWDQVASFEYKPNKVGVLFASVVLKDGTWYQLPQMQAIPVGTDIKAEDSRFVFLRTIHRQMVPIEQPSGAATQNDLVTNDNKIIHQHLVRYNLVVLYGLIAVIFFKFNDTILSKVILGIVFAAMIFELFRGWKISRNNKQH